MVVLGSYQKWFEAKAADHHPVTDEHLPLNALGRMLDRNVGPVQMARDVIAVAVPVVFRRGVRHFHLSTSCH
jgi:hypothetical protein